MLTHLLKCCVSAFRTPKRIFSSLAYEHTTPRLNLLTVSNFSRGKIWSSHFPNFSCDIELCATTVPHSIEGICDHKKSSSYFDCGREAEDENKDVAGFLLPLAERPSPFLMLRSFGDHFSDSSSSFGLLLSFIFPLFLLAGSLLNEERVGGGRRD